MPNIEEIELGLDLGTESGEYFNTEVVDGKLQLKKKEESDEYESEGYWVSEVLDLERNFRDYQKVSLDIDTVEGSEIVIEYRTSDNKNEVENQEWKLTELDGSFSGETKQFIQVKLNLEPKTIPESSITDFTKKEDLIKLDTPSERQYYFEINEDEEMLKLASLPKATAIREGKINTVTLNKEDFKSIEKLILEF